MAIFGLIFCVFLAVGIGCGGGSSSTPTPDTDPNADHNRYSDFQPVAWKHSCLHSRFAVRYDFRGDDLLHDRWDYPLGFFLFGLYFSAGRQYDDDQRNCIVEQLEQ